MQTPSRRSLSEVFVRALAVVIALVFVLSAGAPRASAQGQAQLTPPHTDYGVDLDGDTLYDVLRVDVSLTATVAGRFMIDGELYDDTNTTFITSAMSSVYLDGPGIVSLDFSGYDIRASGIDGPYGVSLYVYDDVGDMDDWGFHLTAAYLWSEFERPGLVFTPPHSDFGLDTDGDTLFNFLRVQVFVDIVDAGTYLITADLYSSLGTWIGYKSVQFTVGTGSQIVDVDFTGWAIRQNGEDGPYLVMMSAYDTSWVYLGFDTHSTQAYLARQFELPPASLSPPHADAGVDADGDGLYDSIAIDVSVLVDEAGDYEVDVELYDSTGMVSLGYNWTIVTLDIGLRAVRLELSTIPMVAQGLDGPYQAYISLYTSAFESLGTDTHVTAAYTVSQFDALPASFDPPHSDRGVDRDTPPDGLYNVLEVDANVLVNDTAAYAVAGVLFNLTGAPLTTDQRIVQLTSGRHAVTLTFSSLPIWTTRSDGPYRVELFLLLISGGSFVQIDNDTYITGPYLWTEFQDFTITQLDGTVRDQVTGTGIPNADVSAYDYRNEWVLQTTADLTGAYSLVLYQGDWVVAFDDFEHASELVRITITMPATFDAVLFPSPPDTTSLDVVLPTWNDADYGARSAMEDDNRTFRLQFDWQFGDRDGMLSQQEFNDLLAAFGFVPPSPPEETQDGFLVDGIPYALVPGSDSFAFINVAGPIDNSMPPILQMNASYANATVPSAPQHIVDVNATYDTPESAQIMTITFPPGFVLDSFTAPPEVAVTGVGTQTATIDPGLDPDPFDMDTAVWIRLNVSTPDLTPPVVVSAVASPDPVDKGQFITVTAVATDDVAVASVRLEVWNATSDLVVNATMPVVGPGTYAYTFSPATVGTYAFTVTAMDLAGNPASRDGQFDVVEHNPPVVTNAAATPDPQGSGLPVLLSATVTDDTGVASVTVEVRNPGGALVGNYTMALNATSGDYEATRSFLAVGAYAFTVWGTDVYGNVGSASGTFAIVDQTPPTADAGPDQSVIAGEPMAFDGSGSTDNDRIAAYWWNFTDGGSVSLTGATPGHTFSTPGTYLVTLTVADPAGNVDNDTVAITVLAAVGAVEGTVTDPGGAPVSGASVHLLAGSVEIDATTTDGNGDYSFGDMPPGTYTVRVTASGFEPASRSAAVTAGHTTTVDIQLQAAEGGIASLPLWLWAVVIVAVVAAVTAVFLLLRRKRKLAQPEAPPAQPQGPAPPPEDAAPPPPPEAPPPPEG